MDIIEQAARNNALWVSRVCRSHHCSDELRDSCWLSFNQTPPFYPNAITLENTDKATLHYRIAGELRIAGPQESFALKDSFRALDLQDLGYEVLFDSHWIHKDVSKIEETDTSGIEWSHVTTPMMLMDWERSWARETDNRDIFLPTLLDDKNVLIIAAYQQDQIIAGCIANSDAGCVGISNMFLPGENAQDYRRSAVLEIQKASPNVPLVGYETGSDLAGMREIGFETIGELRVWFHRPKADC